MDTLKDIISGTRTKKANNFNMDLFKQDLEMVEDINSLSNTYSNIIKLDIQDNSTDRFGKNISTTAIGLLDNEAYLINIKETEYNSEQQVNASTQELTLNGFHYFTKKQEIEDIIAYMDAFLIQNKIDCSYEELLSIMELNTQFNVLQYQYETTEDKVWITADANGHLKKITRKPHQQKAHTQTSKSIADTLLGF